MRPVPVLFLVVLAALAALSPAAARAELPQRVAQIAAALDVPASSISVWVQRVDAAAPLLVHHPDEPRTPASTLKLLPTFAALQGLTPAHRWRTEVHALGPVRGGVLDGDLLLRGLGDPWLVAEEYRKLIEGVRRAGIERIDGDLVFDVSYYDLPVEDPGAFDNQPDRVYNLPPHPLLVNFNAVRFEFVPGAGDVRVRADPALPNIELDNRLGLAARGCYGYQRGVALNVVDDEARRDKVMLEGRFPTGCDLYAMTRTVLTPESYAFGLFDVFWRQLGGDLSGRWRLARPHETAAGVHAAGGEGPGPIHVHESPPLGDIVRSVNKYSNNVMTRQLQLALGAERFGAPATPEKGEAAILEVLVDRGVDVDGLVLDNPSGLSRAARISARQLGTLLVAAFEAPFMPEFVSSLSLAGLDGTMRGRFAGSDARGLMHLKTGTMDEVSAIAGYVQARDGARYAVAVLVNSPEAHRGPGEEIQDALLRWLFETEARVPAPVESSGEEPVPGALDAPAAR